MPEGLFFDIACAPIFAPKCPVFAPNGCHKQYTKGLVRHDKNPVTIAVTWFFTGGRYRT